MSDHRRAILSVAAALALTALTGQPIQAAIQCQGPYQVIKGHGLVATPYCENGYLASVAREYGMRVSADAVRNNPSVKEEVCHLIGADIRVKDTCAGYVPEEPSTGR